MKAFCLTSILLLISFGLLAQKETKPLGEFEQIQANTLAFSQYILDEDWESIGNSYTRDAKIFPGGKDILKGKEAIMGHFGQPSDNKVIHHHVVSEEIKILGEEAYDYGYYEGSTRKPDGSEVDWHGKYVIVWKKIDGQWLMYLDIWNAIR